MFSLAEPRNINTPKRLEPKKVLFVQLSLVGRLNRVKYNNIEILYFLFINFSKLFYHKHYK